MTPVIHAYIVKALRRVWGWSPEKRAARARARTPRKGFYYLCDKCGGEFLRKETAVDHIEPVVQPELGFVDWNTLVGRLFCHETNLAVLCKPCHKLKTKVEAGERAKARKGVQ